jgi:hypothetical protein
MRESGEAVLFSFQRAAGRSAFAGTASFKARWISAIQKRNRPKIQYCPQHTPQKEG